MLKKHSDEIFGADNWLSEELKRESRISAWDMDGGRVLRMEHEANCDARNLAAEHALDCAAEENAARHRAVHRNEQLDPGYLRTIKGAGQTGEVQDLRKSVVITVLGVLFAIFVLATVVPYLLPLLPIAAFVYAVKASKKNNQ